MPCTPYSATRKFRLLPYIAVMLLLVGALSVSENAEAVRRAIQIPVGQDTAPDAEEEPAPEPVKPKAVKKIAPVAEPAPVTQVTPMAEEVPAQPATPPLPIIDATAMLMRLEFAAEALQLDEIQRLALNELTEKMQQDSALRVTLNSFASPREGVLNEARRVSLQRATEARNYLIGKGIARDRINVRALGDQTADAPKDRIDVTLL